MRWVPFENMMAGLDLPPEAHFTPLARTEISVVTERLRACDPDIVVRTESGHLEDSLYATHFALRGESDDRDFYGLICRSTESHEIIGIMSLGPGRSSPSRRSCT